jgi:hypothetical protein
VELVTRISVAELKAGEGLLREALSSLYTIFGTTREIMRKYGPTVAQPKKEGKLSFGYLSVIILNNVLHPVLSKWHSELQHYEALKSAAVSPLEHEKQWDKYDELRNVLNQTRLLLSEYANLLAEVSGVPSLITER